MCNNEIYYNVIYWCNERAGNLHFAVLQEFQQLILSSVPIIHFGKTLAVILITLYLIKEKDVQEQINTVFIN